MTENQPNKRQAPVLRANLSHNSFEQIISGKAEAFEIPRNKSAEKTAYRFSVDKAVYWCRKGYLDRPNFKAEFTDIETGEVAHCLLGYTELVKDPQTGEDVYLIPLVAVNDVPKAHPVVAVTSVGRKRKASL